MEKVVLGFLSVLLVVVAGYVLTGLRCIQMPIQQLMGSINQLTVSPIKEPRPILMRKNHSLFFNGIDTGDLGRTEQGRSDTTMVVTINPKENKSTMISLDRDILTDIVGNDTQDKLNHAYAFGGAEMAINTVQELLDIPIHHYVSINMKGLKDLIDAVGGIEVDNTIGEFTLDGITVPAGKIARWHDRFGLCADASRRS